MRSGCPWSVGPAPTTRLFRQRCPAQTGASSMWARCRELNDKCACRPSSGRCRRLPGGRAKLCRPLRADGHDQIQLRAVDALWHAVFPQRHRHDCYQHHEHGVLMQASWLRKQSGQAVVVVAVAVLVLTAILMLALDGGGIYLDKRQLQNAADAAALAGAEKLMVVNPSYTSMHGQAIAN